MMIMLLQLLEDKEASDLIAGIAVHWYEDPVFPVSALTHTHEKHPDKFILSTEVRTTIKQ